MDLHRDVSCPYFNPIEKQIIYSALDEAADHLRKFYCFSPREWFNHCYDLKTESEGNGNSSPKKVFAEVRQYIPTKENFSPFPTERYQICLFDKNILRTLWQQSKIEFYPFMVYILTHELVHVARFCQNLHPFECDPISLKKEEEKVNQLTRQVLNSCKNEPLNQATSLYHSASS